MVKPSKRCPRGKEVDYKLKKKTGKGRIGHGESNKSRISFYSSAALFSFPKKSREFEIAEGKSRSTKTSKRAKESFRRKVSANPSTDVKMRSGGKKRFLEVVLLSSDSESEESESEVDVRSRRRDSLKAESMTSGHHQERERRNSKEQSSPDPSTEDSTSDLSYQERDCCPWISLTSESTPRKCPISAWKGTKSPSRIFPPIQSVSSGRPSEKVRTLEETKTFEKIGTVEKVRAFENEVNHPPTNVSVPDYPWLIQMGHPTEESRPSRKEPPVRVSPQEELKWHRLYKGILDCFTLKTKHFRSGFLHFESFSRKPPKHNPDLLVLTVLEGRVSFRSSLAVEETRFYLEETARLLEVGDTVTVPAKIWYSLESLMKPACLSFHMIHSDGNPFKKFKK